MYAWTPEAIGRLDWIKAGGLLPAIVQDADSNRVLMLGYMDRTALAATLAHNQVTFFSRRRKRQWVKGETSGHVLQLVSVTADCDGDTLLIIARPRGPTCHRGTASCFVGALAHLDEVVAGRSLTPSPESYTSRLLEAGVGRIAQKVGEEAVETALAAVGQDNAALLNEAADLVYHLLVLLRARGLGLAELEHVLGSRRKP